MAIGITGYAYRWAVRFNHIDVFALLELSREAGAEMVQICDNPPPGDFSDSTLTDPAQRAAELGLTLEVGIKGSQPEQLRRNLEVSKRLGSRFLRVVLTGPGWEPTFMDSGCPQSMYVRVARTNGCGALLHLTSNVLWV
ncbi:MAG: hypothetical protein JRG73_05265 [Deltaproteobacteria bacterium]|nr:hypothetical protein [Deltaproteobacteria bacterium]